MKKLVVLTWSLVASFTLSGCMDYAYNPEGVLFHTMQDLKNDNFADFRDHFVGSCYTFASTAREFDALKRVVQHYDTPLNTLNVSRKHCVNVVGERLPGHETIFGHIYQQERCEIEIADTAKQKKVFSITMSCFHWNESGRSASAHLCSITKLSHWRTRPDGLFKPYKLCEAL
jgi:hypothetical protein